MRECLLTLFQLHAKTHRRQSARSLRGDKQARETAHAGAWPLEWPLYLNDRGLAEVRENYHRHLSCIDPQKSILKI